MQRKESIEQESHTKKRIQKTYDLSISLLVKLVRTKMHKLNLMQNTFISVHCHESDIQCLYGLFFFLQAHGESNCKNINVRK